MKILRRIKGLIVRRPNDEWAVIEAENKSIVELYRDYIDLSRADSAVREFSRRLFFWLRPRARRRMSRALIARRPVARGRAICRSACRCFISWPS